MNLDFVRALVRSLEACYGFREGEVEQTTLFIISQSENMPDYFSFSLKSLSRLIEFLIFLRHFKRFHKLTYNQQINLISFFRSTKVPFISMFLRFIESSFLMNYLEYKYEKKI